MASNLSKTILEMKFMKRTKEKVLKEEEDRESRAMYAKEITDRMLNYENNFVIEPSYTVCEDLNDGRFSFRGMNPDIELIVEAEMRAKQPIIDSNVSKEVDDAEMTAYYGNVMKTIKRKFESKKQRHKMVLPEPKFKKPKQDDI